jgi:hypothetical protein
MKTLLGTLIIMSTYLAAGPCTISPGQVNCHAGEMGQLSANGVANMAGTKFSDSVTIFGQLNAKECSFKQLEVHGDTKLSNSKLQDNSNIYGSIELESCAVSSQMNVYSNKTIISNSSTNNIIINSNDSPTIVLKNTTIHGDITFEGSFGAVKCLSNCKIEGKIHHGTLTKQGD